jgi:small subunit ribosomal protein S17
VSEAAAQTEAAVAEAAAGKVAYKRRMIGRVASDKMAKTVVVEVVRYKMDRMYKKYVKVRRRYQAHDEANEFNVGDRVEIMEHRPISKHKRWKVVRLIERAPIA